MISEYILRNAKKDRARVGIGLVKVNKQIAASLRKAEEYADITVFGEEVEGLKCELMPAGDKRDSIIIKEMVKFFKEGEIDAIVRGNIEAYDAMHEIAHSLGYKKVLRGTIIKDIMNREYLLAPAALAEGNSMNERLWMAEELGKFAMQMGMLPKFAVLQSYDVQITEQVIQSMDEAAYISDNLRQKGWNVDFVGYAIEKAVELCNIIITRNGIVGNAIWRTITGLNAGRDLGCFALIPEVFIDDSKYWNDYFQSILFAVAMVNSKKA